VTVRTAPPLPRPMVEALPGLAGAEFADGAWTLLTPAPARLLAELARRAAEAGAELLDVELRRPSLEDVLLELTGRGRAGGAV